MTTMAFTDRPRATPFAIVRPFAATMHPTRTSLTTLATSRRLRNGPNIMQMTGHRRNTRTRCRARHPHHRHRLPKCNGLAKNTRQKGGQDADISPLDIDPSITWDSIGGLEVAHPRAPGNGPAAAAVPRILRQVCTHGRPRACCFTVARRSRQLDQQPAHHVLHVQGRRLSEQMGRRSPAPAPRAV
ncbi:hypothetical protein, variant 1 [Aphanomyces astaci]|uniref:Uncharacterized protein n=1 Tax=Aphanomyces astaci TaxID=112090 RepID=W4FX10_APHAT|nr:hypothetical protein H257_13462 [Aphanomyces astaci]XP_009839276.1 hypothetical protein, variant 4 [Aphanomyces astaci]XP_009839277.1 hypothetical protein, variant 2 [Aphanomyces astaci]XP_009839278.1 hypothetical protein, variant 3 [Aphanomyces astaci]XP_009839279.1 hypothetical protein, variant 1 [Aphanomyces astaci]ETV71335.1 hypothetical protein H257_13462 [Aphanomyces astaci]ETV71336.1 hypothetical protein, variant 1 [Aphanomyces astaci]ETV71337.1 hypothetical protein, variant 2 [Aph|eukprot:XP_009839275.1 hypothetical protein H257_13462 [Aphanomyces astaci]